MAFPLRGNLRQGAVLGALPLVWGVRQLVLGVLPHGKLRLRAEWGVRKPELRVSPLVSGVSPLEWGGRISVERGVRHESAG